MRSWTSRALPVLALCLLLPATSACEFRSITLRLPDFDAQEVQGVRFWRQLDGSGDFEPGGELRFSATYLEEGEEWIDYTIIYPTGYEGVTLPARVVRDGANPRDVTIDVYYDRMIEEAGWFRVSAFNRAGDSSLSEQRVFL